MEKPRPGVLQNGVNGEQANGEKLLEEPRIAKILVVR